MRISGNDVSEAACNSIYHSVDQTVSYLRDSITCFEISALMTEKVIKHHIIPCQVKPLITSCLFTDLFQKCSKNDALS